jgi:hypothetical protein
MTDARLYCDEPDCERPVAGHGKDKCASHLKQLQRTGRCVPIAEKLSLEERAIAAGTAMLEADSDDEYATRRRAWINACKDLGGKTIGPELTALQGKVSELEHAIANAAESMRREHSEEVKRGMAAAKARGKHVGRPVTPNPSEAAHLLSLGKVDLVARLMGVGRATVYRILKRGPFETPPKPSSPRTDGGSP